MITRRVVLHVMSTEYGLVRFLRPKTLVLAALTACAVTAATATLAMPQFVAPGSVVATLMISFFTVTRIQQLLSIAFSSPLLLPDGIIVVEAPQTPAVPVAVSAADPFHHRRRRHARGQKTMGPSEGAGSS